MKKLLSYALATLMLVACTNSEKNLQKNAEKLCKFIPDPECLQKSEAYMTEDFYSVVEEMVSLPDFEPVVHQWEFYFVTADGTPVANSACEVLSVDLKDDTHAVATIRVSPQDADYEAEEHSLVMQKQDGKWLIADFDDTKQFCMNYIDNYNKELATRTAIGDYLTKEIGVNYLQGELCIPVVIIVAAEEIDSLSARVWGDYWVDWYNLSGDTLFTVSGGDHPGCFSITKQGEDLKVTAFEQTVDGSGNLESAKRIFGNHYDVYHNIQSNQDVREAFRREAIREYVKRNNLQVSCYKDFGWDTVQLFAE